MRVAFYAPMKSPNHPVPSGDRLMARLLIRALELGGHQVDIASEFRTYASTPEAAAALEPAISAELERLRLTWKSGPRPELWFCYHPYYKSPDTFGPGDISRIRDSLCHRRSLLRGKTRPNRLGSITETRGRGDHAGGGQYQLHRARPGRAHSRLSAGAACRAETLHRHGAVREGVAGARSAPADDGCDDAGLATRWTVMRCSREHCG